MRRHLKILFILLLLVCSLIHSVNAEAWQIEQKKEVQNEQQPVEPLEETTPSNESEQEQYSDEESTDEEYTDEEQNQSPFPEIITAPKRTERAIADDKWLKLTSDEDFKYEDAKPKVENEGTGWWTKIFMNIFSFLASTAGNIIIIAIVVLIVLIIVVRIVQLNGNVFFSKKDKKIGTEVADELSDEYVPDDWEKVIQDAAKAGNYRLAVRHGYRYLLSLLQEKNLISFQVAKTNYQYVFELAGTQLHKPFMQLTRDYEYAWYGGFNIAEERFEDYYHKVTTIKKELDQKG
jgi:flagellar basal body-associated protein FliL